MEKEFAAGAVVFRKENGVPLFLMVYSVRNRIWGFPKGHIEAGESERAAALREIREETGVADLRFMEGFREEDAYPAVSNRPPFEGRQIEKHSIYFLAETATRAASPDRDEIGEIRWLPAEDAEQLLKFEDLRQILRRASLFLSRRP